MTKDEISKIVMAAARQAALRDGFLSQCLAVCESPIERAMLVALHAVGCLNHRCLTTPYINCTIEQFTRHFGCYEVIIVPQYKIGTKRADFAIASVGSFDGEPEVLLIECDGREFHDRTKQQVVRDKKRDRGLMSLGYPTLRFAGAEIFRDAIACANEALDTLISMHDRKLAMHWESIRREDGKPSYYDKFTAQDVEVVSRMHISAEVNEMQAMLLRMPNTAWLFQRMFCDSKAQATYELTIRDGLQIEPEFKEEIETALRSTGGHNGVTFYRDGEELWVLDPWWPEGSAA